MINIKDLKKLPGTTTTFFYLYIKINKFIYKTVMKGENMATKPPFKPTTPSRKKQDKQKIYSPSPSPSLGKIIINEDLKIDLVQPRRFIPNPGKRDGNKES